MSGKCWKRKATTVSHKASPRTSFGGGSENSIARCTNRGLNAALITSTPIKNKLMTSCNFALYCYDHIDGLKKQKPTTPLCIMELGVCFPHCLYLVHISVCTASYPLDQLEILLRIPPGQVDTGVHHCHCRLRLPTRSVDEPQQYKTTDILRKTYGVRKSQPESTVAPTWPPLRVGHAQSPSLRTLSMESDGEEGAVKLNIFSMGFNMCGVIRNVKILYIYIIQLLICL